MSENENKYDISKHPLVVIALAVVGTFGFSYQFVLPIMTAKMQNDVDKLLVCEKQISLDKVQIGELEKKLSEVKTQLQLYETANLFIQDNPYPAGLRQVRIGDPIEKLTKVYDKNDIKKKNDGFWEINNNKGVFDDVVYYFNKETTNKEITHIAFTNSKMDYNIQRKLEEIFGKPKEYSQKGFYSWDFTNETIYKASNFQVILMNKSLHPGYFPAK